MDNYDLLFDEYQKLKEDYDNLYAFTRKVLATSDSKEFKEFKAELLFLTK